MYRRATRSRPIRQLAHTGVGLRDRARTAETRLRERTGWIRGAANPIEPAAVATFVTSDGRAIPVLDGYRYRTKPGWKFYGAVRDLVELRRRDGLTPAEVAATREAVGTRCLGLPLDEIEDLLTTAAKRTPQSFLWSDHAPPVLKPSVADTERRIGRLVLRRERQLRAVGFRSGRDRPRLLEIGYTSGGHSLAAFERLGFEVAGVDNYYDGVAEESDLPHFTMRQAGSHAELLVGDISDPETLTGREFELVFSESVIEHLRDPAGAFRQCRRLTAPGGSTVHSYEPYHSVRGGHSPGTLDAPFGHVRVSAEDLERYLRELRPNEVPVAVPWVRGALNRCTQAQVRAAAERAGLRITHWCPRDDAPDDLTAEIVEECLSLDPELSPQDLVAGEVVFSGRPERRS